jgi:hypothetical protein
MIETNGKAAERNGTAQAVPLRTVSDGNHDAKGRFTRGNTAAVGNPFARRMAKLRSIVLDAVSEEDLRAVIQRMVEQAKAGDPAAAKLLLLYTVGRPAAVVEPDELDQKEWALMQQLPRPAELLRAKGEILPVSFVRYVMALSLPELAMEFNEDPDAGS